MFSAEDFQDKVLTCRDCGKNFTFTAGEQAFYASKGLSNTPGRCSDCRAARRSQSNNSQRAPREQYETTCSACGNPTVLPFVPRDERPVYCSDCYQTQRSSRPRREEGRSFGGNFSGGRGSRDRGGERQKSRW